MTAIGEWRCLRAKPSAISSPRFVILNAAQRIEESPGTGLRMATGSEPTTLKHRPQAFGKSWSVLSGSLPYCP